MVVVALLSVDLVESVDLVSVDLVVNCIVHCLCHFPQKFSHFAILALSDLRIVAIYCALIAGDVAHLFFAVFI